MSGKKRFLSLLLCIIMVLSPFATIGVQAEELIDTANYFSSSASDVGTDTDIVINGELFLGAPTEVDEKGFYSFTAQSSGTYFFYSDAVEDTDPYATLYDSDMQEIEYDDDTQGLNFRVSCYLETGETCYIKVNTWDQGSFTVNVEKSNIESIEFVSCDFEYIEDDTRYGEFGEFFAGCIYYYSSYAVKETIIKVNYSDGRDPEYVGYYDDNDEWTGISYRDNQEEAPWTVGGTNNTITLEYMGKTCTFNATVVPSPVESIEFVSCDFEYIENTNGHWSGNDDGDYFYYSTWKAASNTTIKVNYNDGRPSEVIDYCEHEDSECNCYHISNQEESPWTVGGTNNTITLKYMGKTCTFNATVIPNPVESIEFVSCDFEYIENDERYGEWNENEDFWYDPCYAAREATIKVNYNDGREPEIISYDDYDIDYSSDQYNNPWTIGGENTITLSYLGKTCTFSATVIPNPVESIEFVSCDFEYIETDTRYGEWDENDDGEFFYYDTWHAAIEATIKVNYNDGREPEIISYDDYDIDYSSDQYDNPWTIGGENTITLSYFGKTCTFSAVIVPNPVESIEFVSCDFEYIENDERYGYWDENDEGEFFYYKPWDAAETAKIKVNYNDGREPEIISCDDYDIDYSSDQYDNPWTIGGENTITLSYLGKTCTFSAVVNPSPVESIEFVSCDFEYIENDSRYCYWEDGRYFYSPDYAADNTIFKINYKDGSSQEILYKNDGAFYCSSNQENKPWTVGGENTITVCYLGKSCTFNAVLKPNPVESIEFVSCDFEYIEHFDGYWDESNDDEFFYYYTRDAAEKAIIKVNYSDGRDPKYIGYYDEYNNGTGLDYVYDDYDQYDNPWTIGGKNTITLEYMGKTCTFSAVIVPNPIKNVQIIKNPQKTEYLKGECLNIKGMVLRVNYKDNTYEDFTAEDYCNLNWMRIYSNKLDRTSSVYINNYTLSKVGAQEVTVQLFGVEVKFNVTVKENKAKAISIKEAADKSIIITVTNNDNSTYDMKLIDAPVYGNDTMLVGRIYTDKGCFDGGVSTNGFSISIGDLKSNDLGKSEYYNALKFVYGISNGMYVATKGIGNYNGTITANNIDKIIEGVLYMDSLWWNEDHIVLNKENVYKGESIRKALLKYFAIDSIDLTLSKYYNATNDTYTLDEHIKYVWTDDVRPVSLTFENGVWKVKATEGLESQDPQYVDMYITLSKDLKIVTFGNNGFVGCSKHTYTNCADAICNNCGQVRSVFDHTETVLPAKPATYTSTGLTAGKKCSVCGTITLKQNVVPALARTSIKGVKVTVKDVTYTGKSIAQKITVKLGSKTLKLGTDYTVTYKNNKNVGKATITITGKGAYKDSVKATFKINPKKTSVSKVTAGKKSLKVSIKKQTKEVTGYEIQYSTSKKFKSAKKVTIKKAKTTSTTIKKLKAKKTYYVRVRTYKTVNGKKYYSGWSTIKSKKTK